MKTQSHTLRTLAVIAAALTISACNKGGAEPDDLAAYEASIVSTKDSLKGQPKTLRGDSENSLYGFDELRPPPSEDAPL